MKKKLFVFVVLAMVLVACKPAVKGGGTSNSETPLELTAENLAGKWASTKRAGIWFQFTADNRYTDTDGSNGTFVIINNKTIKCSWVDALCASQKEYNTTVYKDYIVLNNERCNRATE